ncbi:DUF2303 family protein [Microvirga sp. SYSU G3D207]|uniref:DUF2303 family protein n=2 Tax=Microvirga arsenatis TaxID=2692265 RepID=A0ABW9Z3F6_9HYPH|nr:DUF2303 family protein [Microvirga arsenatis]NBJ25129.1 DUF2303 family protein [Microvirga arsenatis]
MRPLDPAFTFDGSTIDRIAELGTKATSVEIVTIKAPADLVGVPAEIPVAIIHGDTPTLVDVSRHFESYRTYPGFKRGTATALTLDSFIALVDRHKTGDSVVFANTDWKKPTFTAVIDYHQNQSGGAADNGKHRIHYAFPLSEEWQAWNKQNGEPMEQAEFAAFLEDRIAELSSPTDAEKIALERDFATTVATPADLVQLSRGLQVNVEAVVKSATTLQTGEGQIVWEEVHKDADGKPLKVPGIFLLSIAPFFMGEPVRIPVRLRYRKAGSRIVWFYQLYRPDQHITERVRDDLITVARQTGLPTFEGTPEMQG